MRYVRPMVNLQELKIAGLDLFRFPAGFGEYLEHFSPTLRSVDLGRPYGISSTTTRLPPVGGRLRGRLALSVFGEERLLKDMVVVFGGTRFTSMDLRYVRGMGIVLEACACTLEALRIYPDDTPFPCKRVH